MIEGQKLARTLKRGTLAVAGTCAVLWAMDPRAAENDTIAIAGITGPKFSEERIVVTTLCGRPVSLLEVDGSGKTVLYSDPEGLMNRLQQGHGEENNRIELAGIYQQLAMVCQILQRLTLPQGEAPKLRGKGPKYSA